jgi:hypothetical protein
VFAGVIARVVFKGISVINAENIQLVVVTIGNSSVLDNELVTVVGNWEVNAISPNLVVSIFIIESNIGIDIGGSNFGGIIKINSLKIELGSDNDVDVVVVCIIGMVVVVVVVVKTVKYFEVVVDSIIGTVVRLFSIEFT